ncbi:hypothetical protein [Flavobacterium soyangense]|uniref:Uncharacterized protein n=1 Tax=Flavobacterium soyangense TaxID=2023265 RepID=A0A930U617_9FLAO|nr:hypothetical protein [Flavobacterium soyangense]MBF2707466.1 hypothetical protein [Flavobacterium soyangense]
MDLQTRKISFVQEFLSIQSEEVISRLEKYLKKEKISMEEKAFIPMSMKEFESRIDQSMEDSKNGRVIEAKKLLEEVKKWS